MKIGMMLLLTLGMGATLLQGGCGPQNRKTISDQKASIGELEMDRFELEIRLADMKRDRVELRDKVGMLEGQLAGGVAYRQALEAEVVELGGDTGAIVKEHGATIEDQAEMVEEMKRDQAAIQERLETLRSMLWRFKDLILAGEIEVRILGGRLALVLTSEELFQSGGAFISENGKRTLAAVAVVLADIEGREFQVACHIEDVPVDKSMFSDSWDLSASRSLAVVRVLVEKGIAPQQLSGAGYSIYSPLEAEKGRDVSSLQGWIEIVLMPRIDELPETRALERELR